MAAAIKRMHLGGVKEDMIEKYRLHSTAIFCHRKARSAFEKNIRTKSFAEFQLTRHLSEEISSPRLGRCLPIEIHCLTLRFGVTVTSSIQVK